MTFAAPPPRQSRISTAEAGRPCPECRFSLKEGAEAIVCGACGAVHHASCWAERGGCAVVGCPGANGAATTQQPTTPTAQQLAAPATQPTTATAPQPTAPAPPPPAALPPSPAVRAAARGPWSTVAAIVVTVGLAAAVLAFVLTRGSDETPATRTIVVQQPPSDDAVADSEPADSPAEARDAEAPLVADEATREEIRTLLQEHHAAIVAGDYRGAWDLLTRRKQAQKLREDGYDRWAAAQATLRPYLDPSGLDVEIQDLNPATGVARVRVTGMSWSKPGARCAEWSGITWVKYEDGVWRYDPGYSTTPERERAWKDRFPELLGGAC